jgi:hypothetical protein
LRNEPNSGLAKGFEKTNPSGREPLLSDEYRKDFGVGIEFSNTIPILDWRRDLKKRTQRRDS